MVNNTTKTKKCVLVFGLILFFSPILFSQSVATYYFGKDGRECSKELAILYRKTKLMDFSSKTYAFEDYSMSGTLKATGYYLQGDFGLLTGPFVEYYENGNEKLRGTYLSDVKQNIKSQKVNSWYLRYENGSMQLERLYAWDTTTNSFKSFIINFWDTARNKRVIDGVGEYSFTEKKPSGILDSTEAITFSGSIKYGLFDGIWKGFYENGTL